mmetsp:Transcript_3942/g.10102  ORF Transcript_3942/g.10102 Transcript_3942/m.10102 type:complete len:189 (-) Transcript_3942:117-683(-)
MAWDIYFDNTWSQRINKEETALLEGLRQEKEREGRKKSGRRHRRSGSSIASGSRARSSASSALSAAGSHTLAHSASASAISENQSAISRMSQKSGMGHRSYSSGMPDIPEHLRAVTRFPVNDKDLITGRVEKDPLGKVPRIKMHPEKAKAMWWPGRGHYIKFNPEFCFDEPPKWHPDDILKQRMGKTH